MPPLFPSIDAYENASNWPECTSGGPGDWNPLPDQIKKYTNAYIVMDGKVLLGMKKRGFGAGKYNGFGGKVDQNETSLEAAARELEEEAGISAPLKHAGILLFVNEGTAFAHHIDLYRADSYSGEVTESEEMRPEWFKIQTSNERSPSDETAGGESQIPFERMWDDDQHWFPFLLSKRFFIGRADFRETSPNNFIPGPYWFCAQPDT